MAQTVARHYMQAFLSHDYDTMWTLLHPQVQAQWPTKDAFVAFWKGRFHDYTLNTFTLGHAHPLSYWVNPETMEQYNQVEEVAVSLKLTPKGTAAQLALQPPEVVHPSQVLQHLPLIVQEVKGQGEKNSQWLVIAGGPADLEAPILPPMTPTARSLQVPILMYHHVSDSHTTNVLDWSLTVNPLSFTQQMDYLKAQGYHTITFNQFFNALYYGGPLPTKPIMLTFDDGYEDAYQFAYPILRQHGFSGMFYIITGKVNWQGQMTWSQLREMLVHGMQMGSHTIHHVDMGQVLLNSPEQAQQELQLSQLSLQQNLGIVIQHFCYPSGEPFRHGSLYTRQHIVALLAQNGYVDATTDPGMTGFTQQSANPFVLLRIRVDGRESLLSYEKSLPW